MTTPRTTSDLLVLTPWYPNPEMPYAGSFVRETVRALGPHFRTITVVHVENRPPDDDREPFWTETTEGRVLWIGVPMDPMTSRHGMILRQREEITKHAKDLVEKATIIHCHAGAPTGAAVAPLVPDTTRFVLTEHATYVSKVLRDEAARKEYEFAYRRADVFTNVGTAAAHLVESAFPGARDQVVIVPNPVPLATLPVKTDLTAAMSKWLFVGNLFPHKGVVRLVRSFARWVECCADPDAHLTLVGSGVLEDRLRELAAELGVADRITFAGSVDPADIGQVYVQHDVLVHLSTYETFGLTCVEAAACGLPVVVTQCGGPQDTLALHSALGLCSFVPQGDDEDIDSVVEAVSALQRTIDPDNIHLSRQHLQRSYSPEAVGKAFHAHLTGHRPPGSVMGHDGMRVLAVAINGKQARNAEAALRHFADFGGSGVYLAGRTPKSTLPESIRVVDISGIEEGNLATRLERAIVLELPAKALRGVGKAIRAVEARSPGSTRGGPRKLRGVQRRHQQLARNIRHGPYDYLWRNVGPWYVARRLESSGTLAALDMTSFDCFVMPDDFAIPFAYRALQLNPDLDVRRRWTRTAIARVYAEQVLLPAQQEPDEEESGAEVEIEVPQQGPIP